MYVKYFFTWNLLAVDVSDKEAVAKTQLTAVNN